MEIIGARFGECDIGSRTDQLKSNSFPARLLLNVIIEKHNVSPTGKCRCCRCKKYKSALSV